MSADGLPFHPFKDIWLHPRRAIQAVVDRNPEYQVMPLAVLTGISNALDRAVMKNAGDNLELPIIIGASIGGGILGGVLMLYVFGWLLKVTGKWIGGKSESENLRAAIAWGSVPIVCTLPLWIPMIFIYGKETFSSSMPTMLSNPAPYFVISAVEFVLAIWSLVASLKCIAQVQGFSSWKALGNLLLAAMAIIGPVLVLIGIVALVRG